jgi:hypothetical protein
MAEGELKGCLVADAAVSWRVLLGVLLGKREKMDMDRAGRKESVPPVTITT